MAPGLVDDAATQRALVAHAGVRAIVDLWDRLDVALFGIGGPAWSVALVGDEIERAARGGRGGRRGPRRPVRPRWPVRLPGPARPGHRLRRAPRSAASRSRIGVASGEAKVRPILGALRAGIVRTLVTDVATAEAVVALDDATLAPRRPAAAMTAREPAVLGLDLGTTEVKAGLVTPRRAAARRSAAAATRLDVGGGHGWAEQDPGAWWSAVVGAVRALRATDSAEVVAIGVDGHGPTLVAVDARGEATRPGDHVPRLARERRSRRAGRRHRRPRLGARRPAGRALGRAPRARRGRRPRAGTCRPGSGWRSG